MRRLLTVFAATMFAVVSQADAAFTFNPTTGHWYGVVHSDADGAWTGAETNAVGLGGHLVTINDAAEQSWLTSTFGASIRYWIGLTDAATEGTWVWASGEAVTYLNWDGGEPNNSMLPLYGEDYAVMNWDEGRWNDWDHLRPDYIDGRILVDGIAELDRDPCVPEPSTCLVWLGLSCAVASGTYWGPSQQAICLAPGEPLPAALPPWFSGSPQYPHTRCTWGRTKRVPGLPGNTRGAQRTRERRATQGTVEGPRKNPRACHGGKQIRRYLLSHFWHYHRLGKLNYCVRDGNRCDLSDMVAGKKRAGRSGPAALVVGCCEVSRQRRAWRYSDAVTR